MVIKNLKKEGVYIWSIEQTENSNKLNDLEIEKNRKHAIILGNEVKGVSQNALDFRVMVLKFLNLEQNIP